MTEIDIYLKPCPICGGKAEIRYACEAIVGVSEMGGYQPYCTDCLIAPPYAFFTKQSAADWWNDRKEKNERCEAEWSYRDDYGHRVPCHCTNCGCIAHTETGNAGCQTITEDILSKFCPNCGAKMIRGK